MSRDTDQDPSFPGPGGPEGEQPGTGQEGPGGGDEQRESHTETHLTTRVRVAIPGARPMPPMVLRTPVPGQDEEGDPAAPGQEAAGGPAEPSGAAGGSGRSALPRRTPKAPHWHAAGGGAGSGSSGGAAGRPAGGAGGGGSTTDDTGVSEWFRPKRPGGSSTGSQRRPDLRTPPPAMPGARPGPAPASSAPSAPSAAPQGSGAPGTATPPGAPQQAPAGGSEAAPDGGTSRGSGLLAGGFMAMRQGQAQAARGASRDEATGQFPTVQPDAQQTGAQPTQPQQQSQPQPQPQPQQPGMPEAGWEQPFAQPGGFPDPGAGSAAPFPGTSPATGRQEPPSSGRPDPYTDVFGAGAPGAERAGGVAEPTGEYAQPGVPGAPGVPGVPGVPVSGDPFADVFGAGAPGAERAGGVAEPTGEYAQPGVPGGPVSGDPFADVFGAGAPGAERPGGVPEPTGEYPQPGVPGGPDIPFGAGQDAPRDPSAAGFAQPGGGQPSAPTGDPFTDVFGPRAPGEPGADRPAPPAPTGEFPVPGLPQVPGAPGAPEGPRGADLPGVPGGPGGGYPGAEAPFPPRPGGPGHTPAGGFPQVGADPTGGAGTGPVGAPRPQQPGGPQQAGHPQAGHPQAGPQQPGGLPGTQQGAGQPGPTQPQQPQRPGPGGLVFPAVPQSTAQFLESQHDGAAAVSAPEEEEPKPKAKPKKQKQKGGDPQQGQKQKSQNQQGQKQQGQGRKQQQGQQPGQGAAARQEQAGARPAGQPDVPQSAGQQPPAAAQPGFPQVGLDPNPPQQDSESTAQFSVPAAFAAEDAGAPEPQPHTLQPGQPHPQQPGAAFPGHPGQGPQPQQGTGPGTGRAQPPDDLFPTGPAGAAQRPPQPAVPGAAAPGGAPAPAPVPTPQPAAPGGPSAPAGKSGAGGGKAKRGRSKVVLAGGGVVGVVAAAYVVGLAMDHEDVPKNTTVLGVDIGGMSRTDAQKKLDDTLVPRANSPLKLAAGGKDFKVTPSVAGLQLDTNATVKNVAHKDYNPVSVLGSLIGRARTAEPALIEDGDKLNSQMEKVSGKVGGSLREGGIDFRAGRAVAVRPKAGTAVDADASGKAVRAGWLKRMRTGSTDPIALELRKQQPKVSAAEVDRAMKDFAKPAMSGLVTLRAGLHEIQFSPLTMSRNGLLRMKPDAQGHLKPVWDTAQLEQLWGSTFDALGPKPAGKGYTVKGGKVTIKPNTGLTGAAAAAAMDGALKNTTNRVAKVEIG